MPKKKEVTIDMLAEMTQRGFLSLEGRMDGLGKRMDNLEKRMDNLGKRMEEEFLEINRRLTSLETRITDIENEIDNIREFNHEILERVGRIEQLVDEDYRGRIQKLEQHVLRLETQLASSQK